MSEIEKRQHYYFKGRTLAENGNFLEAIESFKFYSTVLANEDQHIPQLWISDMYKELGKELESLKHMELYAIGCSDPKAAEVYKHCAENYLKLGLVEKALLNYKMALERNPKIAVKTKIEELKKWNS